MARYNGILASLIKGSSTGGENAVLTGVSYVNVSDSVPQKHFSSALIGVRTQGVSGTYSVTVVGSIAGATYVVAGVTGLATNVGAVIGSSAAGLDLPRPAYVAFASAEAGSGFTATVTMAGEYN